MSPRKPDVAPEPADWARVIEVSEAKAAAEAPVEPAVGDWIEHPAMGKLEVVRVDPSRIEVRDRSRRLRKLARQALEFRLLSPKDGRRVLRAVRRPG